MGLCEPFKSFIIEIFYSEALSMWTIPPETLRISHLHVYCGPCLLLIVDMICIFKLAAVWGFSSLLCLEKSHYSILQTIKWLLFSLFPFLSISGVCILLRQRHKIYQHNILLRAAHVWGFASPHSAVASNVHYLLSCHNLICQASRFLVYLFNLWVT